MQISSTLAVAASALNAQSARLRIISENIANADSTSTTPGGDPYRRKIITFKNVLDRETGTQLVKVSRTGTDKSAFNLRFDPTHPAANVEGYVKMPNVDPIIEMMDLREANRAYQANLNVVQVARAMGQRTLDIIR